MPRAYSQDADLAPFFKGLPNDECQCEHMGYVIRGKVGFRSGGDEELGRIMEVVTKNMEELEASA